MRALPKAFGAVFGLLVSLSAAQSANPWTLAIFGETDYQGQQTNLAWLPGVCVTFKDIKFQSVQLPANTHCTFYSEDQCSGIETAVEANLPYISGEFANFICYEK
ncbi:hypothetical protein VTO42DRAFT_6937 [Malbranchea cinnamomea]